MLILNVKLLALELKLPSLHEKPRSHPSEHDWSHNSGNKVTEVVRWHIEELSNAHRRKDICETKCDPDERTNESITK